MQMLVVVVMRNMLKMLISINQKVLWREGGPALPPSWTPNATGKQSGPNPFALLMQNMVSPFSSEGSVDNRKGRQRESG